MADRPALRCVTRAIKNARHLQRAIPNLMPTEEPLEGFDGTPTNQGAGHDSILGQNGNKNENRVRTFTITIPDPADPTNPAKVGAVQLTTDKDWVMPTGGGYFFTPSIEALERSLV